MDFVVPTPRLLTPVGEGLALVLFPAVLMIAIFAHFIQSAGLWNFKRSGNR